MMLNENFVSYRVTTKTSWSSFSKGATNARTSGKSVSKIMVSSVARPCKVFRDEKLEFYQEAAHLGKHSPDRSLPHMFADTSLFALLSRYSGKTQKQIIEFVRDNYVKRQTFQRFVQFLFFFNIFLYTRIKTYFFLNFCLLFLISICTFFICVCG